jgi:hypothetical protein
MEQACTSSWVKRREARQKVLINIRMRAGSEATEACIRDISSMGVLVQTSDPPQRGSFVELIGAGPPIVARVVWSNEGRFGAELRDRVDIPALLSGRLDRRRAATDTFIADLRKERRAPAAVSADLQQWLSRWLQQAAALAIGTGIALALTQTAYGLLNDTSASIAAGLQIDR